MLRGRSLGCAQFPRELYTVPCALPTLQRVQSDWKLGFT
jgi:hypothetical protein